MVVNRHHGRDGWHRFGLDLGQNTKVIMDDVLSGKRIVIIGLARQGKALARFAAEAGAQVVVSDLRSADQLQSELAELNNYPIDILLGEHPLALLENTDFLAISGGVPADLPIVQEALRRGIPVTNDSFEFMKRCAAIVIGITGSAGKTTTTALTGAMVQASGRKCWVGGNIGRPLLADLAEIQPEDIVVQELSSFQLEQWTASPPVATVLNVTPNHLDRHKSMAAYSAAKSNILRYQSSADVAVLAADDPGSQSLRQLVRGRLREFSLERPVVDGAYLREGQIWLSGLKGAAPICGVSEIPLRGRHNILNVQAAAILADSVGVEAEAIRSAIRAFSGVEHRLELVRTINGVQYVNDSIATAPERAIAALDSFSEPLILLAGGRDKDMVWDVWTSQVSRRTKAVVLFGELAEKLEPLLTSVEGRQASDPVIKRVITLSEAVATAADLAEPGDVILLAPGGTSFDAYRDFAERGRDFRQIVNTLAPRSLEQYAEKQEES